MQAREQKTVIVIIPFGVPGSGKSFIWENIKNELALKEDWSFDSVSSDGVRGELMEELIKKGMDKDAAYQATQRTATTAYNEKKNRAVA